MSQQATAATHAYCGLVLGIHASASCRKSTGFRSRVLAGHMSGLITGVSHSAVLQARCAGALSWWKTNMSPAMLRIADSSSCITNTSRTATVAVNYV